MNLISIQTLSGRLEASVRTLRRMIDRGAIPAPVRIGRALRWREPEINEWVAAGCPSPHKTGWRWAGGAGK